MWSQKNSQRRLQSSTRIELARDLHDSLAQDLIGIGFKLDLLLARIPHCYRNELRAIRLEVQEATKRVRKELFALRSNNAAYQERLSQSAAPLELKINGSLANLSPNQRRIIDELVKNAAIHSKGRQVALDISENELSVSDDGMGFFGIAELVEKLGGAISVSTSSKGTKVGITLP